MPSKDDIEQNTQLEPKKTGNVSSVIFYDDTCFYINLEGKIFVYDKTKGDFHNYNEIDKVDKTAFSAGLEGAAILRTERLAEAARRGAEAWYGRFIGIILSNENPGKFPLTDADKKLFRRYFEFRKHYDKKSNIGSVKKYTGLEDWYNNFYRQEYQRNADEKDRKMKEFIGKWNVGPDERLFSADFFVPKDRTVNTGSPISGQGYHGKNPELKFLINYHNKILEIYKELKGELQGSSPSSETGDLFGKAYTAVIRKINSIINEEKKGFEAAKDEIARLDSRFKEDIERSLNTAAIDLDSSVKENGEFGYIFLPAYNVIEYTLIYKRIETGDTVKKFKARGQDIKLLGIHGDYIYACEGGRIAMYDAFTLENKLIVNNAVSENEGNETVLFSIEEAVGASGAKNNQENNFFVTEGETKEEKRYYIRSLERPREANSPADRLAPVKIIDPADNTAADDGRAGGVFSDIFFTRNIRVRGNSPPTASKK
jgi:hypothetical protein